MPAGSIPVSGTLVVPRWFGNLNVNQVHVGSIPIGQLVNEKLEVTRIGKEAVLKIAGRLACGFESHGFRSM